MTPAGGVAVVTGAASGIGAATARRLAADGATVCIADRDVDGGRAIRDEIGDPAIFICTDVSSDKDIETLIEESYNRFGRLDALVNNVGAGAPGKVTEVDPDAWVDSINICLNATYRACRYAIPRMVSGGGGTIVNVASTAGFGGDYGMAAYNSAKAAVINLTRSMAVDYALDGIRINAVCPGVTETPATARMRLVPGLWDAHMHTIPMRRAAKPAELDAAIAFLTSDEASYITGAVLAVDGGKTAWSGSPDMNEFLKGATQRS